MNIRNKILFNLFRTSLTQNVKFKDFEKGKCCYIFGNGASLKYYDLKNFDDRESIGCNVLFAHKDLKLLNLKYYFVGHPFLFHWFWKNPYSKKYERNKLGRFYEKNMNLFPETQFFTSLTNYFGIKGDNVHYIYHFGKIDEASVNCDMGEIFSTMTGSLPGMIGVAVYLGYSDITLVGCDYTFAPKMQGHFYERGPEKNTLGSVFIGDFLRLVQDRVKIRTVTPNDEFSGDLLPSITYKELTGAEPFYRDNTEIVCEENLDQLNSVKMRYRIY